VHQDQAAAEDNQSVYSGGSGLAPSLISQSINFFPQGNGKKFLSILIIVIAVKTDEDNHSMALGGDKNESGESSDGTDSQDVEASDHE